MRIWSILLMKSDLKWCIHLDLFLYFNHFTHLVSVTAGGPESPQGHIQPISTVDFSWFVAFREHQHFPCWNLLKLYFLGVYSPSLLVSVYIGTFVISLFNFFSYFVWLRITDDGSLHEMCIWSIPLSLFSYCISQAFTLNTLRAFCKIYAQSTFFVLARGGGFNFKISSSLYFHFVIKFRLLLSICGLHFWCLLNLKMLPTPLSHIIRTVIKQRQMGKVSVICWSIT